MEKARELMKDGSRTMKQIAYELGYKHANDFSRAFRSHQRRRTGKS